jgi:hypothetical protein
MCDCNCGCSKKEDTRDSETTIRLARELKAKAIRNLEKTIDGRRRLEQLRKEGKL